MGKMRYKVIFTIRFIRRDAMKKILLVLCFVYGVVNVPKLKSQLLLETKIGKQVWMTKNLDVSTFRNGDSIPHAKNSDQWKYASENKIPAWCYNDYDETNGKKYGKLYNYYAVSDRRGLAPKGFHIPSLDEWKILIEALGGEEIAGKILKSNASWESYKVGGKKACPNCIDWSKSYRDKVPCNTCKDNRYVIEPITEVSGNGDNSSRMNMLPGGGVWEDGYFRNTHSTQQFNVLGKTGTWWSTTEQVNNNSKPIIKLMKLEYNNNTADVDGYFKGAGWSVRCLRD